MKNAIKVFGNLNRDRRSKVPLLIIALVAVIGFSFAACDNGGGGGGGGGGPQTATYTGRSGNETYTLKITENTERYAAQIGDAYVLTLGTKKSTGTVNSVSGGTLTLQPLDALIATFSAIISGNNITGFIGSVTWDGESKPTPLPTTLTGGSQGGNGGGNIVLSGTSWSHYDENHGATEVLSFSSTGNSVTLKDPYINLSGTYTVTGANVTIKFPSFSAQYTGVISDTTLTITTDRNETKIFQKL